MNQSFEKTLPVILQQFPTNLRCVLPNIPITSSDPEAQQQPPPPHRDPNTIKRALMVLGSWVERNTSFCWNGRRNQSAGRRSSTDLYICAHRVMLLMTDSRWLHRGVWVSFQEHRLRRTSYTTLMFLIRDQREQRNASWQPCSHQKQVKVDEWWQLEFYYLAHFLSQSHRTV